MREKKDQEKNALGAKLTWEEGKEAQMAEKYSLGTANAPMGMPARARELQAEEGARGSDMQCLC